MWGGGGGGLTKVDFACKQTLSMFKTSCTAIQAQVVGTEPVT